MAPNVVTARTNRVRRRLTPLLFVIVRPFLSLLGSCQATRSAPRRSQPARAYRPGVTPTIRLK